MKKVLSSFTALTLVIVMLAGLTSCASERNRLLGSWTGTMSLADSFNSLLSAQNEEVADIMKIDKFDLKVTYSFNAGGTYSVDIDNDSLVQAVEGLKENMKNSLRGYFDQEIKNQGLEISVDEMLELSGMSIDELVDQSMEALNTDDMAGMFVESGNFSVEDGKLITNSGGAEEIVTYELDGSELKITGSVSAGNSEAAEFTDTIYPIVLTKAN